MVRQVDAITVTNGDSQQDEEELRQARNSKKTGKLKNVYPTDPEASMATNGRNRRLEPSYKQHSVDDDQVRCLAGLGKAREVAPLPQFRHPQVQRADRVSRARSRYPLRQVVRSPLRSCRPAPIRPSTSASMIS